MENYYTLLNIDRTASGQDIKRAFRERAKMFHPDIAGKNAEAQMRRLLAAYQVLSSPDRRFEYDRAYERFIGAGGFDYRNFLKEREGDPASQAKLVFFLLLHMEDGEALEIWKKNGGLDFPLEKYLDREDWMDCAFLLAEELDKRRRPYEAFMLLAGITREERRRPYFKHFMADVEKLLKELVRLRLKSAVDGETYLECLEILLSLGFSSRERNRWMASMAETLHRLGKGPAPKRYVRGSLGG